MAKKIRKNPQEEKVRNGILGKIKFTDSYTSLILGAIAVLIVGILFIFLAKGNRDAGTSSARDSSGEQNSQNSNTSSTYTIKPGDDLWTISENVYNNGYKWVEIAKVNKLENPGLIYAGNKLTIPTITPGASPKTEGKVAAKNSITENAYTIRSGDNLWDIAVRAYGDGFKWPEIAKVNKLENPDLIFSGNVLKIPR